jgi:hypothetical protein
MTTGGLCAKGWPLLLAPATCGDSLKSCSVCTEGWHRPEVEPERECVRVYLRRQAGRHHALLMLSCAQHGASASLSHRSVPYPDLT